MREIWYDAKCINLENLEIPYENEKPFKEPPQFPPRPTPDDDNGQEPKYKGAYLLKDEIFNDFDWYVNNDQRRLVTVIGLYTG